MPRAQASDERRWTAKRPVLRFVGLFALSMAVLYAITATPWFRSAFFPAYLDLNASISAAMLITLGEDDAHATGTYVITSRYALEIKRGCDGLEPVMLFVAAVLAFPATGRARLIGIALGMLFLLTLNLLRILSLYYTGVFFPSVFETVHVDIWQALFVGLAMLAWIVWAWRASGVSGKAQPDART